MLSRELKLFHLILNFFNKKREKFSKKKVCLASATARLTMGDTLIVCKMEKGCLVIERNQFKANQLLCLKVSSTSASIFRAQKMMKNCVKFLITDVPLLKWKFLHHDRRQTQHGAFHNIKKINVFVDKPRIMKKKSCSCFFAVEFLSLLAIH